jgi:hypothetical protein
MFEFGVHFQKVSIIAGQNRLGFVECCSAEGRLTGEASRLVHSLHEIVADLAGPIAHARAISGTPFRIVGARGDFTDDRTKATIRCQMIVNDFLLARSSGGVISSSGTSPEAKQIECVLHLAAVALVERRWPEIQAIANELLECGELTESQVADLCASSKSKQKGKEQG